MTSRIEFMFEFIKKYKNFSYIFVKKFLKIKYYDILIL